MSETTKAAEAAPAPRGKDIATKARVELKGADTPKPGTVHTFKNPAGTTIKTQW